MYTQPDCHAEPADCSPGKDLRLTLLLSGFLLAAVLLSEVYAAPVSLAEQPASRPSQEDADRRSAQRIVAMLKREFGEDYLYDIDPTNKLVLATSRDAQALESLKEWLRMQAHSQGQEIFSNRPDQYISVVLPSMKDFRRLVVQPGAGGVYNHERRILIAQRLGKEIAHEFTHALHNFDTDPLEQTHAAWVAEGLATMYESARFEGERLVPADSRYLREIQMAGRRNRLIPLDRLLKMDQKAFVQNPANAYGQSGSLLLYLYEQNLLRKFYDTYKATYAQDRTGRLALEQVAGKTLPELEQDWRDWMINRVPR